MKQFTQIKYELYNHINKSKGIIAISIISVAVGIIVGIILSLGDVSYIGLLKSNSQNVIDYVNGSANYITIFWNNFLSTLIGLIIIFVFCLNYYSSYLSLLYIGYQSCVCTLAISQITYQFGFVGIMNIIFSIVPINICLILSIIFFYTICFQRAKNVQLYKENFASSFSRKYFILLLISVIIFLLVNIFFNLIYPQIFKGIYVINY